LILYLLNRLVTAHECDARNGASSTTADPIKAHKEESRGGR
jgi:hypothetical protein